MSNGGANPFDTSDDVNPFGSDAGSGLEHYDPFGGDAKPPSRPVSPPSANTGDLIFHDTSYTPADTSNPFPEMSGGVDSNQFAMGGDGGYNPDDVHVGLDAGAVGEGMEEYDEEEVEEVEEEEASVFSAEFYQRLFDVDTVQVLDRIFRSCVPFRKNFFESCGLRPDLYGTVWVSATLVFVLAAAGNFTNFVRHFIYGVPFIYNFAKLPYGALAVYLYVLLVPLILWGVLAWIDDFELSLPQSFCLYGYAMFPFIIAGLVSIAPWDAVKYTAIFTAALISFVHIALSLWDILSLRGVVKLIALILLLAAHVGITCAFAFYFFKFTFAV
jgi:hypothetical protein